MATVEIKKFREQSAHFGLYRTSAGGSQSIFVRRKVGEPTDYEHTQSRKLKIQREYLTLASQHYAQLTPSQKAITRHQIEEVEYEKAHGKTDIKLLSGRQLFISKEIHSLKTTGQQVVLPHEICIQLTDWGYNLLQGSVSLLYFANGQWSACKKEEITLGNWLFSEVPVGKQAYRVYGEAPGYQDPMLPETQNMSESQIRAYHYHRLTAPTDPFGYNFVTEWTHNQRGFVAHQPIISVVIHSYLRMGDCEGTLKIGIAQPWVIQPPFNWLDSRTYQLDPPRPYYEDYYTIVSGADIVAEQWCHIVHLNQENTGQQWRGNVYVSFIT